MNFASHCYSRRHLTLVTISTTDQNELLPLHYSQAVFRRDCDEAGDYNVPNVLRPRDLVFRPDIGHKNIHKQKIL